MKNHAELVGHTINEQTTSLDVKDTILYALSLGFGHDPLDLGQPGDPNDLPIIELATDRIVLVVGEDSAQSSDEVTQQDDGFPLWQRWNDYGIGLLLKGKAELKQAADAFAEVERLGRFDGPLPELTAFQPPEIIKKDSA